MDGHVLDKIVKFNAQASGRDKLFRLVQYCSKLVGWYLQQASVANNLVKKLQLLSTALSTSRKFLRVGKSVDFIHSALQSLHLSDDVLRWTITLSKINQAVYLVFDHIVLAGRIGIAKVDKEKWNRLSAQFWLVTLILGITRDLYDLFKTIGHDLRVRDAKESQQNELNGDLQEDKHLHKHRKSIPSRSGIVLQSITENKPIVLDLAKNLSDLVLPMEALGHIQASPGMQGFFGVASSLIGIVTTWQPLLRLVPS